MPGYKPLPITVTGPAADQARQAETRRRGGDPLTAVRLLEEALEASARIDAVLPGWLCGRLAALYRTLERYDDEVALLERYRDSQTTEEARVRYDARLSKARTIAERKRRSDSGALLSVRQVLGKPRRRSGARNAAASVGATPIVSTLDATIDRLSVALSELALDADRLSDALSEIAASARMNGMPVEQLVEALRTACRRAVAPHQSDEQRAEQYSTSLLRMLAVYFDDTAR